MGAEDVDLIVATDSEGILGIGDWGSAALRSPSASRPRQPSVTERRYVSGNRHARVRDQRYDELIDAYVTTATKLFPNAMLHWEDFGVSNAQRILNKYADRVCTFNDSMQGTAAVVLAAAFAACGPQAAGCATSGWSTAQARPGSVSRT